MAVSERATVMRGFGERVRAARVAVGMSEGELAGRCGFATARLVQLEKGQRGAQLWQIVALCRGLGVRPNQLVPLGSGEARRDRVGRARPPPHS